MSKKRRLILSLFIFVFLIVSAVFALSVPYYDLCITTDGFNIDSGPATLNLDTVNYAEGNSSMYMTYDGSATLAYVFWEDPEFDNVTCADHVFGTWWRINNTDYNDACKIIVSYDEGLGVYDHTLNLYVDTSNELRFAVSQDSTHSQDFATGLTPVANYWYWFEMLYNVENTTAMGWINGTLYMSYDGAYIGGFDNTPYCVMWRGRYDVKQYVDYCRWADIEEFPPSDPPTPPEPPEEMIPWGLSNLFMGLIGMMMMIAGPVLMVVLMRSGQIPEGLAFGLILLFIGIGLTWGWIAS